MVFLSAVIYMWILFIGHEKIHVQDIELQFPVKKLLSKFINSRNVNVALFEEYNV